MALNLALSLKISMKRFSAEILMPQPTCRASTLYMPGLRVLNRAQIQHRFSIPFFSKANEGYPPVLF